VEAALELEEGVVMGDLDFSDGHLAVWLRWLGNPGIAVAPIDGAQAHALSAPAKPARCTEAQSTYCF